ncbi:MAG: endonuclease III [Pseudomonadota bacterium]|nr:endonuclease III [Pseudomonadota bacterium]
MAQKIEQLHRLLKKYYPDAHCALTFETPFQLLVATVLSAQCTDERVNKVTPILFENYPDAKAMAQGRIIDVEKIIKSTGFFRVKAKNIVETAKVLVEKFRAEVPQNKIELVKLPGVGSKTANVVLGTAFDIPSGIVVDTHVSRLSQRMGMTNYKKPYEIEKDLEKKIPKKDWIQFSHLMIWHGRKICKARSPDCARCFLQEICPRKNYD